PKRSAKVTGYTLSQNDSSSNHSVTRGRSRSVGSPAAEGRGTVEVPPDDDAQDLRGATAPEEEAGVPEVALDRVLGGERVRGEDARGLVADPVGRLRGEELGHRRLPGHGETLVDRPRGVVDEHEIGRAG